jgi:hypothetical protein
MSLLQSMPHAAAMPDDVDHEMAYAFGWPQMNL